MFFQSWNTNCFFHTLAVSSHQAHLVEVLLGKRQSETKNVFWKILAWMGTVNNG